MKESNLRSVIKGLSWRIVGTADTITIAYFITGNITKAISIGGVEVITKLLLYYGHERAWIYFKKKNNRQETRVKSLAKALTWRLTATLDTIFIAFVIISIGGGHEKLLKPFYQASAIGTIELFTKILLFYIHERIWNKIGFGLIPEKERSKES